MTWTTFHTTPNATGQELDDNLTALARMGIFPCTTGGTANAIVLTLADTNAPPLNALSNYQEFGFVAGATNNGATTIKVGSTTTLNAYKDTPAGPVALAGAEIVQNCGYIAMYDLALNGGVGGYHVRSAGMVANSPINPSQIQIASGATMTRFLAGTYTVAFTVVPANTTQDVAVTLTGTQLGDFVHVGLTAAPTAGLMFNGRVPAVGSVTLRAANVTGASIAAFTLTNVHLGVTGATP
jgi:hypothetical protein